MLSRASRERERHTPIQQLRVALRRATETFAVVDLAGERRGDGASACGSCSPTPRPYDADDLIERVGEEALPEEQPPEPVVNQDRRDNVPAQTPVPQYDP